MESKINNLSMKEILNSISFPIVKNEFRNTYKHNVDIEMAMDFEDELSQMQEISEIEQIIYEYEEIFDKELYIFHIARLLKDDLENLRRAEILKNEKNNLLVFSNDETGKNKRRFFVNAKNLLKMSDVVDIVMKKDSNGEFEIYSSRDFIDEPENVIYRKKQLEEKINSIEKGIGLDKIITYFDNSDFMDICKYPNLAILLMVRKEDFAEKVKRYIQYMDIDKMLIIANTICFNECSEDIENFSKEEYKMLSNFTQTVSEIIGEKCISIKTSKFEEEINYNEIKEKIKKLLDDEKYILENFIKVENKILVDSQNVKDTILKLDENAEYEELEDKTNIFYLPNKNCYIIQPINNSFYGDATYVIEKDWFEEQKYKFINNRNFNRIELERLKMNNSKFITKLVHTGWENILLTFFEMRSREKYTKEDNEDIEKIVREIKK